MVNDELNYDTQIKKLKLKNMEADSLSGDEYISGITATDKLVPVVTIVVYWDAHEWDGARSLHEMFDKTDASLLKLVPNYWLNLLVPREIEDFAKFKTDLGAVMEYISCAEDKSKMQALHSKAKEQSIVLSNEAAKELLEGKI